ncbi:hypothetical protein LRP88_10744 [Fusarium phalaenopsidis]
MEELRDQLTTMLQSYRHYHLHSDEMEDAERREMEDSANLARDTFRAMFRGLRDLNSARQRITERYLLTCNEIFAICNIGRAVTDEGDILAEEAIRDWRGQRAKAIKKLMDAIATDERDAREVQEDLAEYQGLDNDDLTEEERNDQRELLLRQENIGARKKNHELKEYLVTTRNSFVTQELRNKYNERVATDEIKIFCVSNKDYWDHRDEPKTKSARFLQLSGILQVRKHCISIVANSQRRIATRYIKDQIPAFLAQVDLWVQSGARTASEERRPYIEYKRRQVPTWSESAKGAGRVWEGWHHGELPQSVSCSITNSLASYAAFCRQYGDYCTPAVGPHNWNEEIMEGMIEDLEDPWQVLCNSIQQRQTNLVESVDTLLDTASEQFGTGSHQRRKNIIWRTISNQDLFTNLMRAFRDSFHAKAEESQTAILDAVVRYLDVVQETFDLVRSENVARESEQDPEFRLRVEEVARTGRETIQRALRVIDA